MSFVPHTINEFPNNSLARAYSGGARRTQKVKHGIPAVGSRRKVFNGNAHHTSGGLTKKDLFFNRKTRRIVSRKRHNIAKREKRLQKYGYFTKKGVFGAIFKKK